MWGGGVLELDRTHPESWFICPIDKSEEVGGSEGQCKPMELEIERRDPSCQDPPAVTYYDGLHH